MKLQKTILMITLFLPLLTHAASYSNVTTVKALTLGADGVRVKLDSMKELEGCVNQKYYYLSTPTNQEDKLVSALLTAKISKQKINFQLSGCETMSSYSYPKIRHIYFCDTALCN